MPLKLKIPFDADGYPALRPSSSPLKARGRIARLRLAEMRAQEAWNREARMQVTMICYTLWAGFWLQFVIGVPYNMPGIHSLSGGNWYIPDYEFYLKTPGSFPFSIAGNFVFYSALGSAVAILFGWVLTRGVAGKWRLRLAVSVFITITLGWSIAAYRAEEAAWTVGMDKQIARAREMWRMSADWDEGEWSLKYYRLKVEQLEKIQKTRKWVPRGELW